MKSVKRERDISTDNPEDKLRRVGPNPNDRQFIPTIERLNRWINPHFGTDVAARVFFGLPQRGIDTLFAQNNRTVPRNQNPNTDLEETFDELPDFFDADDPLGDILGP